MHPTLSVIVPTFNEAQNIHSCLESVQEIADEIIVMDNFSSDGTLEIVRSMNVLLYQRTFDNYSINKNAAIEKASMEWILLLDADERLTPELRSEIQNALPSTTADAFRIKRDTYFRDQKVRCWSSKTVTRLFRKGKGSYHPSKLVHEELHVPGGRIETLNHPMKHYTFRSFEQYLPKVHSYTSLAAREAYDRGERAGRMLMLFLPPARFAKTYFIKGGMLDGMAGLTISWLSAYSVYLKMAKLWEIQNSR